MKVAIVHYWLVGMRGGEKVVEELCRLYPQADIFTHVARPSSLSATIRQHRITESFIAQLPFGRRFYQGYLPLMPRALEALDLTPYDLVISSEAGPAKGVITAPDSLHVCYCHSPMRYVWDQYHVYRQGAGPLARLAMPHLAHRLRMWDTASAARVDHFVANSGFVARRIAKCYRRDAAVIHPPVDTSAFAPDGPERPGDFYLFVGELVSYKRPDLAIEAFNRSGRRLVVVGDGSAGRALRAAAGPNVEFLGRVDADMLKSLYARCRALIFPGVEDFGIAPVEAMAAGRPVVAFSRGGAAETVLDGKTGVLFHEQTAEALIDALARLEQDPGRFTRAALAEWAGGFSADRFRSRFASFVERRLEQNSPDETAAKRKAV